MKLRHLLPTLGLAALITVGCAQTLSAESDAANTNAPEATVEAGAECTAHKACCADEAECTEAEKAECEGQGECPFSGGDD